MASTINGTSTGNGGLISTGDDSGILNIQTNETTAITVDASQNVTLAGSIKPLSTSGIIGTTTNNDANAGSVGEYVESVVAPASALSLVNNTPKNITSISLTAGDWDVSAFAGFSWFNTTVFTSGIICLSQASVTLDQVSGRASYLAPQAAATGNLNISTNITPYRYSLSSTTTIYFVCQATFSVAGLSVFGRIAARRIR